ncbi:hypothetical protein QZM42_33545 [Burkholderia vietnamiensis]|uniref:hypothetical protein n=1 Tax=Burkholderia vietnamiensis TaxID=60552 RepID=UPI00264AA134|nr:hypothetical protein [Burkholderia vietnamiensis]MDN7413452.1 hypothetical protein [Burkholderia vietnamiensis]
MSNDYRVAFKAACADLGAISALLGFEEYPGVDALLRSITELIAGQQPEPRVTGVPGTRLARSIEQWRRCDPDLMSKQSQAAIFYALKDAKHDILALADAHPGQPEPRAEVMEAEISAAARVLSDSNADLCYVDRDDNWKIHGDEFRIEAKTALEAAAAARTGASS